MPTYNPLIGWTSDDGSLMGWNGSQNAGGADNGYHGVVDNWADFGKALGWGLSSMGPTGIINAGLTAINGKPTTVTTALINLLGIGKNDNSGGLSAGNLDINPANAGGFGVGALAGTAGTGLGLNLGMSSPTMGNSLTSGMLNFAGSPIETGGTPGFDMGGDKGGEFNAGAGGNNSEKNSSDRQSFAIGGFTGGTEGQPRGEVHGQELVLSAPAVRALGPVANELATVNALATPQQEKPGSWAEMIQMHHPEAWG